MEILRYAAFTTDPAGGNPAGVVLDAGPATVTDMQRIAAEVGYSETAFLAPREPGDFDVRYFSPLAEVPFCGHATIASAVAHAERAGTGALRFRTIVGVLDVVTESGPDGIAATLTSVTPRTEPIAPNELGLLLRALRVEPGDLDPDLPVRVAYAGARHPIVALRTRDRLAGLDYEYEHLRALMSTHDWTTVDVVWREAGDVFHARNPFPPGGIVEDPATGAAAAALAGYLRELRLVDVPSKITIRQGEDLGRPSRIDVTIPADTSVGIDVTGAAVAMATPFGAE